MNQIETMRQALEYIERHATIDGIPVRDALRQVIEQAEKVEPVAASGEDLEIYKSIARGYFAAHPPTAPAQPLNDFDMRGVLASRLLCWHRLAEAEAQDLICFFEGVRRPAPAQPAVPQGWRAERIDEYEIRVVSAEGEAWRLRNADKNDMFNNFIFRWAEAMLSAAPAAETKDTK